MLPYMYSRDRKQELNKGTVIYIYLKLDSLRKRRVSRGSDCSDCSLDTTSDPGGVRTAVKTLHIDSLHNPKISVPQDLVRSTGLPLVVI